MAPVPPICSRSRRVRRTRPGWRPVYEPGSSATVTPFSLRRTRFAESPTDAFLHGRRGHRPNQEGPVVLVGHSYGGAVARDHGRRQARTKVTGLVYVAGRHARRGASRSNEPAGTLPVASRWARLRAPGAVWPTASVEVLDRPPARFHERPSGADVSRRPTLAFMAISQPPGLGPRPFPTIPATAAAWGRTKPVLGGVRLRQITRSHRSSTASRYDRAGSTVTEVRRRLPLPDAGRRPDIVASGHSRGRHRKAQLTERRKEHRAVPAPVARCGAGTPFGGAVAQKGGTTWSSWSSSRSRPPRRHP